jgi:hypothetical protein
LKASPQRRRRGRYLHSQRHGPGRHPFP